MKKPEIGDHVFYLNKMICYDEETASLRPCFEMRITLGIIKGIISWGYTTYRIKLSECMDGNNLIYPRLKDFEEKVFYTYDEAFKKAEKLCDEYDRTHDEVFHEKIRRTYKEASV